MRTFDSRPDTHLRRAACLCAAGAVVFALALSAPAQAQSSIYGFDNSSYGVFSSPTGRSGGSAPPRGSQGYTGGGNVWRPGSSNVYPPGAVGVPRPRVDVGAGYGTGRASGGVYGAGSPNEYGAARGRGNITVQTYGSAGGTPSPSAYASLPVAALDAGSGDYEDYGDDAPLPVYRAATGAQGVDPRYNRRLVSYTSSDPAGTIIVDTGARYLYLVQGGGKAVRYGIGVGREGFAWSGTQRISRKAEWPDWRPPAEMIQRRPDLPNYMPGGPDNPLGARAMYLGNTLYRIHGSNEPDSIGQAVSSGCIRMRNQDVIDLYGRVGVGTVVRVI